MSFMNYKKLPCLLFAFAALGMGACTGGADNAQSAPEKKCAVDLNYDKNSQFSLEDFKNPPDAYRIVPFWSWNETMEPAEVRRQLRLMKEAGWGGSMVHSRTGLLTDYLGEDWFKAVDACVDESRKLGMFVWLYDEDKWPSGFSGGTVLQTDINYAMKSLFARPVGAEVPAEATPIGKPKDGIQIYVYRAKQGNPWFNGTSYVDTMSKAAMGEFKRLAYESYYNRYKDVYGSTIVAEFTDEPAISNRSVSECWTNSVPYSSDFIVAFKKAYGYDPVPHFHKLFGECDGAKKFRLQYFRTLNSLFEKNFMGQLGDYLSARGAALTGHCMAEDAGTIQHTWSGRVMPYYRKMGIPGIDHLSRRVFGIQTGKQCQSVCNQMGKTRMLSEMYGCSGGSLTFEDREWITHQQMILGVNLIVPHLSLFSMTGCRKRDFPQNINYQQPWWNLNSYVDVPLARACYAMAQGKYAADILVLHPQESIAMNWFLAPKDGGPYSKPRVVRERVSKISESFHPVLAQLCGQQLTFDLGDEQMLEENGFVDGKRIGIGQMSYGVVVVPEIDTIRPSTFDKLKKFKSAGGLILRTGSAPKFIDGEKSAELDTFFADVKFVNPEDLGGEIEKFSPAFVKLEKKSGDSSQLWTHVRNLNDGSRLIMLANLSRAEKLDGVAKIRGGFSRAQVLDVETGKITDIAAAKEGDTLELPISIETADALYVRVSRESPQPDAAQPKAVAEREISGWSAKRLDDNSMTLDYVSFSYDGGKKRIDGEVPVLEAMNYLNSIKYDGDVKVVYAFNAKNFDPNRKLRLVVEYPERAEIRVNGKEVKYAGLPAWRDFRWLPIDITGLVKDGKNTIEMHYRDFKYGDLATYKPQWRRYGTELEAVYLVGDFSVVSVDTGARPVNPQNLDYKAKIPNIVMIKKDALAITNPAPLKLGDATTNGLPFYAGRLAYSANVKTPKKEGERIVLKLGNLDCPVAEVLVDGKRAGVIKNTPFEIDITGSVSKPESKIEVVLYASLRNLMDCPHHALGELMSIWPRFYTIQDLPRGAKFFDSLKAFADGTWKSKDWNWDYCQIEFGNVGKISLITKK